MSSTTAQTAIFILLLAGAVNCKSTVTVTVTVNTTTSITVTVLVTVVLTCCYLLQKVYTHNYGHYDCYSNVCCHHHHCCCCCDCDCSQYFYCHCTVTHLLLSFLPCRLPFLLLLPAGAPVQPLCVSASGQLLQWLQCHYLCIRTDRVRQDTHHGDKWGGGGGGRRRAGDHPQGHQVCGGCGLMHVHTHLRPWSRHSSKGRTGLKRPRSKSCLPGQGLSLGSIRLTKRWLITLLLACFSSG